MRSLAILAVSASLAAQTPAPKPAPAPTPKLDLGKALMEVARIRLDTKTNFTSSAFWLSPSMLEALVEAYRDRSKTESEGQDVIKEIRGYQVFMVQREYLDGLGDRRTQSAEELRPGARLENGEGYQVAPVESLPPEARDLIGNFKRGMESNSKGQHFELLIFPAKDAKGHPMEQAGKPGRIGLHLGGSQFIEPIDFNWHYPIDALSAPKECSKCHETVSASWSFCAYCGTATAVR